MKSRNKFFVRMLSIMAMFVYGAALAEDAITPKATELACLEQIGKEPEFIEMLKIFFNGQELNSTLIQSRDKDLYNKISELLLKNCTSNKDLNTIADSYAFAFAFDFQDKKYHITVNTNTLFESTPMQTAFLFVPQNMNNLSPGDELTKEAIKQSVSSDQYFTKGCSTYNPASYFNNDDTDVNKVADKVLGALNAANYFIAHKNGQFRGLLSKTKRTNAQNTYFPAIKFSNYQTSRGKLKEFARALAATSCNNLVLYHVLLFDETHTNQDGETYQSVNKDRVLILSEPFEIGNLK